MIETSVPAIIRSEKTGTEMSMKKIRVAEMFAGVGGFRLGLEGYGEPGDAMYMEPAGDFVTVWANQWEPATKVQHAVMVYEKNFGLGSVVNDDINQVKTEDIPAGAQPKDS